MQKASLSVRNLRDVKIVTCYNLRVMSFDLTVVGKYFNLKMTIPVGQYIRLLLIQCLRVNSNTNVIFHLWTISDYVKLIIIELDFHEFMSETWMAQSIWRSSILVYGGCVQLMYSRILFSLYRLIMPAWSYYFHFCKFCAFDVPTLRIQRITSKPSFDVVASICSLVS